MQTRAFPFPFAAALAVSNDCDGMTRAAFLDWHGFVNSRGSTAYGDGLDLEVGDSFFVWSGGRNAGFALYQHDPGPEDQDSADAALILELARMGWLDTLHSFGNFLPRPATAGGAPGPLPGARADIARALERLAAAEVWLETFVNHSGSPSNVGGPWASYQRADTPGGRYYCLDLMQAYGFRYFWIDPCINMAKFGDGLDYGTQAALRAAINAFPWEPLLRRRGGQGVEPIVVPAEPAALRAMLIGLFNRTVIPVAAQDGRRILAFKRHRGEDQPLVSTFGYQVPSQDLDQLEARRGAVVVYQHFGVTGPRGRAFHIGREHRRYTQPPVLDADAVACWQEIAERASLGRLFVTTTGRLLNYVHLRDGLRFSATTVPERWVVRLEGLDCPAMGFRPLTNQALNGLALLVPETAPEIVVLKAGMTQPLPVRRAADPLQPGWHAVHLPWQRLEWPEGLLRWAAKS